MAQCVGSVDVGWEVDPYAIPLLQTAHRTGARVVLRHVAGTEDLSASVGATHPPGTPLLKLVRELRTDRGPVLLITALHRDFASTDTLAALAIADVGVALDDPRAATPWTADIITGTDLAAAVRILSALPVARSASESAVRLAQGGTTLAGLLLVTGEQNQRTNPASFRRWLNPVNAAAATALVSATFSASRVLRLPDPTPQPLTAWHALDPEIVYSRLAGGARPLAVETGTPAWRRVLDDLSYSRWLSPLRKPAAQPGAAGGRDPARARRSADAHPGRRRGGIGDRRQQRRRPAGRGRDDGQRDDRRGAAVAGRCGRRRTVRRAGPAGAPRRGPGRRDHATPVGGGAARHPHGHGVRQVAAARRRHRPGRARGGAGRLPGCWWPRTSRSTNPCSPASRCRWTSRWSPSPSTTPTGPACCSRAARSSPATPARSWWPPESVPPRNARSLPSPTSRHRPACRPGCAS